MYVEVLGKNVNGYTHVIDDGGEGDGDDGVTVACQRTGVFFADLSCLLKVPGKVLPPGTKTD